MATRKQKRKTTSRRKAGRPNPAAARRRTKSGKDRPGFDIGGASPEGRRGVHTTIPGGPRSGPFPGGTAQRRRGGGAGSGGGPTDGTSDP